MKPFFLTLLMVCYSAVIPCLAQGEDTPLSPKELKTLTKKANKGNVDCMLRLALHYSQGENRDSLTALRFLKMAADKGNAEAQAEAGLQYMNRHTPQDTETALHYNQLAADQGNAMGLYNLGVLYLCTEGDANEERATECFKQAAMKGMALAQYFYGLLLGNNNETTEQSIYWLQKAVDQGFLPAFSKLAIRYIAQQDFANALKYAQIAANEDDATAQGILATILYAGCGIEKDAEAARYWALKSAQQNNDMALCVLGSIYYDEENYAYARSYLEKAAALGNDQACLLLASMYAEGKGVDKNEQYAINYLKQAANRGNKNALKRLNDL